MKLEDGLRCDFYWKSTSPWKRTVLLKKLFFVLDYDTPKKKLFQIVKQGLLIQTLRNESASLYKVKFKINIKYQALNNQDECKSKLCTFREPCVLESWLIEQQSLDSLDPIYSLVDPSKI